MLKLGDRLSIFNYIGRVTTGGHGFYLSFNGQMNLPHRVVCNEIAHTINPKVYCFADLLEEDNTYDGLYIVRSKQCYFPEFDSLEKLEEFIELITHEKIQEQQISIF